MATWHEFHAVWHTGGNRHYMTGKCNIWVEDPKKAADEVRDEIARQHPSLKPDQITLTSLVMTGEKESL